MRIILLAALMSCTIVADAAEYDLYVLDGRSNMDGYGHNVELPEALETPVSGVMIFTGNPVADDEPNGGLGWWAKLEPGHGGGASLTRDICGALGDRDPTYPARDQLDYALTAIATVTGAHDSLDSAAAILREQS